MKRKQTLSHAEEEEIPNAARGKAITTKHTHKDDDERKESPMENT